MLRAKARQRAAAGRWRTSETERDERYRPRRSALCKLNTRRGAGRVGGGAGRGGDGDGGGGRRRRRRRGRRRRKWESNTRARVCIYTVRAARAFANLCGNDHESPVASTHHTAAAAAATLMLIIIMYYVVAMPATDSPMIMLWCVCVCYCCGPQRFHNA